MIEWEEETTATHSVLMKKAVDILGFAALVVILGLAFILL
jgi:hypothetical protein